MRRKIVSLFLIFILLLQPVAAIPFPLAKKLGLSYYKKINFEIKALSEGVDPETLGVVVNETLGLPEFIIQYQPGFKDEVVKLVEENGGKVIKSYDDLCMLKIAIEPEKVFKECWFGLKVEGLVTSPYILSIEANAYIKNVPPIIQFSDPTQLNEPESTMYDVKREMGILQLYPNVTGKNVTIAVLDTGANINLTYNGVRVFYDRFNQNISRVIAVKNFITGQEDYINITYDANGTIVSIHNVNASIVADGNDVQHGTWCAFALAGWTGDLNTSGIAPDAKLVIGKVLDDSGAGTIADVIEGIKWAADLDLDKDGNPDVDIISMSLGSTYYIKSAAAAVKYAVDKGIIVFVAAGNSGFSTEPWINSPADTPYPGVVAVAALTNHGADSERAFFSSYGPDPDKETRDECPDIGAPGLKIVGLVKDTNYASTNDDFYPAMNLTLSGTSMATPIAAGCAALILEARPEFKKRPVELEELIFDTATRLPNVGVTECKYGLINPAAAIEGKYNHVSQEHVRTKSARYADLRHSAMSFYESLWR